MSKLISSSIWNFLANIIVRGLSLLTYPFLVKYYAKADISVFKSIQSFLIILITIIPLGTRHLYISSKKNEKSRRWNLTILLSFSSTLIIFLILLLSKEVTNFFFERSILSSSFLLILPFIAFIKALYFIRLQSDMFFKEISKALIIKQFVLYSLIIIFSRISPSFISLYFIIIGCELIEVSFLTYYINKKKVRLFDFNIRNIFPLDKTSKKFISFMGVEQIFNILAQHFPTMFVVIILGKELAPEFQLPLFAIAVPSSIIMMSVAKVLFPYFSQLREDKIGIECKILDIEFILTFLIFPVLVGIIIFSKEIVSCLFNSSWTYAIFAFSILPISIAANVINNPLTSLSLIKEKPQIVLVYSILLFIFRMGGIYFGYQYFGFQGSVVGFVIGDVIIRISRLFVDLIVFELSISKFIMNILPNFALTILIIILFQIFISFQMNKYISFITSISLCGLIFVRLHHRRFGQYKTIIKTYLPKGIFKNHD